MDMLKHQYSQHKRNSTNRYNIRLIEIKLIFDIGEDIVKFT